MSQYLYNFNGWIKIRNVNLPYASEFSGEYEEIDDLEIHGSLDNEFTFQISVEKAITSMSDTATIKIVNHPVLEKLYSSDSNLLRNWAEKDLEVSIMLYYRFPHAQLFRDKCNCIFTGDIVDISVEESTSTTDQSLVIKASSGNNAISRAIVNTVYTKDQTYRDILFDIFRYFEPYGYGIPIVRDPDLKLSKRFGRVRSYHNKAADVLNEIAKDLDMVWGLDANPWTYQEMSRQGIYPDTPTDLTALNKNKNCYFVDKRTVFDISGLHGSTGTEPPISGINGLRISGDTGHIGLIGRTKSQFTFNSPTEPPLNIGMPVYVDDVTAHLVQESERFIGRINRITINNNKTHCECSYIDNETGLAILDRVGRNTGAYIL